MRTTLKRLWRRLPKYGPGAWCMVTLLVLLAAYAAVLNYSRPRLSGDRLRFDTFVQLVEGGRIRDARILNYDSYVVGRWQRADRSVGRYRAPFLKNFQLGGASSQNPLVNLLVDNRVPTTIDQQFGKSFAGPLGVLLPALMVVVVFVYLVFSYRSGSGLFKVRSGARRFRPDANRASFADVAGQDAAVGELREIAEFLADPSRYGELGARVPRGILLYGPPGCGKTLVARALAGEAGASFFYVSGADFVELYVGVGASRVRDLFREAREREPAIVFIDEIDAIGKRRNAGGGPNTGAGEEQEQALTQILNEMDGFAPTEGILVIGATNRPDVLDPALLRPGRFDRSVGLERADEAGRLEILRIHARGKPVAAGAELAPIAARAVGLTGADLASVMNEAGLLAVRGGRREIGQTDLDEALTRIQEAPERQRRLAMRARSLGERSLAGERVAFDDVAGLEEAIEELAEVKEYLDDPERFLRMGARTPKGYLLVGPPGCGKTLLARAVAGESNAAFFAVSASEFTEVFVGEGAARVRDLFAEARAVAPAILFIDEIDAIGAQRGASVGGHRETEQTLNQILVELDGFGQRTGVVVMAASNRPEILDAALVRPGRFDRTITIGLPDRKGRRDILAVHARDKPLAPEVDLDAVATQTRGLSGADLAGVLNEAALLAARRRVQFVTAGLIDEAIDRISMGISRAHVLLDEEREQIAYHEAGHALVALELPGARPPRKLSIVSRGESLGRVHLTDDVDRIIHSRSALIDEMAAVLGGRVAEELVFGQPGSAASNDLERVGRTARWMIRDLGMSDKLGPIAFGDDNGGAPVSDATARAIDDEVARLIDEARERARRVLSDRREELDRVARALIEHETLNAAELGDLVAV